MDKGIDITSARFMVENQPILSMFLARGKANGKSKMGMYFSIGKPKTSLEKEPSVLVNILENGS
jgi:hypothetical protein